WTRWVRRSSVVDRVLSMVRPQPGAVQSLRDCANADAGKSFLLYRKGESAPTSSMNGPSRPGPWVRRKPVHKGSRLDQNGPLTPLMVRPNIRDLSHPRRLESE